jgi:hypothetical protein
MAKYIREAPRNGFTVEDVTQGKDYPAEVGDYVTKSPDDPFGRFD